MRKDPISRSAINKNPMPVHFLGCAGGGRGTESHLYLLRRPHDNKRTEVRRRLTVPQSRHHSEEGQKLHAASQPVQLCVMSVTWGIIFCFLPFLPSSESQRWVVQLRDRSAWPRHKAGGRMRAGPSLPAMPGFTRLQERVPPTRHIIGKYSDVCKRIYPV